MQIEYVLIGIDFEGELGNKGNCNDLLYTSRRNRTTITSPVSCELILAPGVSYLVTTTMLRV